MDKVEYICNNLNDIANENIRLVEHALNSEDELFIASLVSKIYYIAFQKSKWFLIKKEFNYSNFIKELTSQKKRDPNYAKTKQELNEYKKKLKTERSKKQKDNRKIEKYEKKIKKCENDLYLEERAYSHGSIYSAVNEIIDVTQLSEQLKDFDTLWEELYIKRKIFDYTYKSKIGLITEPLTKEDVRSYFDSVKLYSKILDEKIIGETNEASCRKNFRRV